MRFTQEEREVEIPLTIGAFQIAMAAAWEVGYKWGYQDHRTEQDFDLLKNPWSEANYDL